MPPYLDHAGPSTSRHITDIAPMLDNSARFHGTDQNVGRRLGPVPASRRTLPSQTGPSTVFGTGQIRAARMESRALSITDPWLSPLEEQAKRRRLQRDYSKPYFSEMATAHAERRSPVIHVPTTTTGKPIGLRSAWHRQVRLIARQTMDQSIRSYR